MTLPIERNHFAVLSARVALMKLAHGNAIDRPGISRPSFAPALPLELRDPRTNELRKDMSITGAPYLAETIRQRIAASKQRVNEASANMAAALQKLDAAADQAGKIAKEIEDEADGLLAELGQHSNNGPE